MVYCHQDSSTFTTWKRKVENIIQDTRASLEEPISEESGLDKADQGSIIYKNWTIRELERKDNIQKRYIDLENSESELQAQQFCDTEFRQALGLASKVVDGICRKQKARLPFLSKLSVYHLRPQERSETTATVLRLQNQLRALHASLEEHERRLRVEMEARAGTSSATLQRRCWSRQILAALMPAPS